MKKKKVNLYLNHTHCWCFCEFLVATKLGNGIHNTYWFGFCQCLACQNFGLPFGNAVMHICRGQSSGCATVRPKETATRLQSLSRRRESLLRVCAHLSALVWTAAQTGHSFKIYTESSDSSSQWKTARSRWGQTVLAVTDIHTTNSCTFKQHIVHKLLCIIGWKLAWLSGKCHWFL